MHGIVRSESRESGDIQSEDVKVGEKEWIHFQKKKSDVDTVLDAIEEEAQMVPEDDKDVDEDYELLFGKKQQEEEPKKMNKIVTFCGRSHQDLIKKEKADRQAVIDEAKQEVPYVIDIPRGLCFERSFIRRLSELCELLNEYVDVDDSVHLILARIIKNNNPNVNKDKKSDFINVGS